MTALVERPPRYDADALLVVAARVFTERGYDGTSMDDVARASGLSKSSLYHHIQGKEQVLRLALERAIDPLFGVLADPGATAGRPVQRLEHVVRRVVQVLTERLPYVTLLLRVRGNTATERWALEQRRAFDAELTALVTAAVADGDLRADVPPATITRLLLGMVNSLVEWYRPDAPGSADLVEHVVTVAFDGVRAVPARGGAR